MAILLILLALVGHVCVGAALFNQLHSRDIPRWLSKLLSLSQLAAMAAVPAALGYGLAASGIGLFDYRAWLAAMPWLAKAYGALCLAAAALGGPWWAWWRWHSGPPAAERFERRRRVNLGCQPRGRESLSADGSARANDSWRKKTPDPVTPPEHHPIVRLPGNESLLVELVERGLELLRLPPALEGLSIVHLSDLHFTGRVGKDYFRRLIDLCNQSDPDLVAITGDLVDRAECIPWVPELLGRLESRFGVYFVLGNHDVRDRIADLRRTCVEAGLVDLGGQWIEREIHGQRVVLAGNELPWLRPAAAMEHAPPRPQGAGPLRIALAHSPDQLRWARNHDVDLLLAGHTHGGQIRLPLVGPLVSATQLGVRYASGTFHVPPTVMHVSRGISAELPLRFCCPPEVIRLTLHRVQGSGFGVQEEKTGGGEEGKGGGADT